MTPNTRNACKIKIYSTKHTNNTSIHFQQSNIFVKFKTPYLKKRVQKDQRFMLICMALFIFCIFCILVYNLFVQ